MALYDALAGLELEVDGYALERRELDVSSGFTRVTTIVVLRGGGVEGRGEDVSYDAADHDRLARVELPSRATFAELSERIGAQELYSEPPARPASLDYRRWAWESAALDLALRQAGLSLGEALGRVYRPVRFVVSTRHDPRRWLEVDPDLEFKLDPTDEWGPELMEELAATGRVRILDLKAYYEGTAVDLAPDPVLYRRVATLFPQAVIEDALLEGPCRDALRGAEARLSFDAPVHSVADLEALPIEPRFLNVKPSRFGTVSGLLACLELCAERGTVLYGGGQFELGVGRSQIQALASLFYPDGPNDVAPAGYNEPEPRAGLPRSPLPVPERPAGFSYSPL